MAKRTGTIEKNGVSISLLNDDKTRQALANIEKSVGASMAKAISVGAISIANTAKKIAPVDTGSMANSITYDLIENTAKQVTAIVGPTKDIIYGKYVEYGTGIYATGPSKAKKIPWVYYNERLDQFFTTSGMKAQPFLYPALQRNRKRINDLLAKAVTEGWGKFTVEVKK